MKKRALEEIYEGNLDLFADRLGIDPISDESTISEFREDVFKLLLRDDEDEDKVNKKENKYFKQTLSYFSLLKIKLIRIIKKGLTNSIG